MINLCEATDDHFTQVWLQFDFERSGTEEGLTELQQLCEDVTAYRRYSRDEEDRKGGKEKVILVAVLLVWLLFLLKRFFDG